MALKDSRTCKIGSGLVVVAGGFALLLSAGGPALASASSGTTTTTAAVNSTITLSGLTSAFTMTGNPSTTVTSTGATTMNVLTNNQTGYAVTVQAAAATLAPATAGNTDSIPIGNLKVKDGGATTYAALSNTTATSVHSTTAKSASGGDTVTNDYQLAIPFVNADNYTATLNYIAATH